MGSSFFGKNVWLKGKKKLMKDEAGHLKLKPDIVLEL